MAVPPLERLVAFEGVGNFRDFGGYEASGGRLRHGLLYRSAHMGRASVADLARLATYGIRTVVDLRRAVERSAEPCRRWDGFAAQIIENDLEEAFVHPNPGFPMHLDVTAHRARSRAFYARAPYEARHIDLFRRYFQALAAADDPVLIHCASGKDRTGLLVALTHRLSGVRHDDLMADFLATNSILGPRLAGLRELAEAAAARPVGDEELLARVTVSPDYLEASFAAMTAHSGSVDGYLERALGLDTALRRTLLDRLIG